MTQPVIDTLRVSENLEESGMDRRQAESVARTLGEELGEHVAVQSDLDTGFQGVRSDMALTRSELEAKIGEVRSEMALMRSELEAKIGEVRSEMALMRSELEAKIGEVRSEVALMRSELEARIEGVRTEMKALNTRFNLGFGLMLAFLSVLVGIGLLNLDRTSALSSGAAPVSLSAPGAEAFRPPAPGRAMPAAAGPTSTDTEPGSASSVH